MNFLNRFLKKNLISNLMKIRQMGAELFRVDGQTCRRLIVAFQNFANEL